MATSIRAATVVRPAFCTTRGPINCGKRPMMCASEAKILAGSFSENENAMGGEMRRADPVGDRIGPY